MSTDKIKTAQPFDPKNPNVLQFDFADDEKIIINLTEIPEGECLDRMLHHGAKQKFGDSCAGGIEKYDSVAGCRARVQETVDHVLEGEWYAGRIAGGRWVFDFLAEAASEEGTATTPDEAKEFWDSLSEDSQATILADVRTQAWNAKRIADAKALKAEGVESKLDFAKMFNIAK